MLRSLATRKELDICFRCEYYLLRTNRISPVPSENRSRSFTNARRSRQSSDFQNDVRATSVTTKHDKPSSSSRLRRQEYVGSGSIQNDAESDLLRLSTPGHDPKVSRNGKERLQAGNARAADLKDAKHYSIEREDVPISGPTIRKYPQRASGSNPSKDLKYPAFRHPDVTSDRVELGVQRLGEPATIRVLPERRERPRRKRETSSNSTKKEEHKRDSKTAPLTSFDSIAESLNSENQGAAGIAESMNNIETLRAAFLKSINQFEGATQDECLKLATTLERGFTPSQLKSYIKLTRSMKQTDQDRLDELRIHPKYRVSKWYSGPSKWPKDALKRVDPYQAEYQKDRYAIVFNGVDKDGFPIQNSRHKLINTILNLSWGIRPREERLQEGSVSMEIDKDVLEVLLRQKETVFYNVSQLFKVTTEVSEEYSLIRVIGPYDSCVDSVRAIISTILLVNSKVLDVMSATTRKAASQEQKDHLMELFNQPKFWHDVENQTQTLIKPSDDSDAENYGKILVYYLNQDSKAIDGVRRRVLQMQKVLKKNPKPLFSLQVYGSSNTSLVPVISSVDMPLTERHLNWYRWTHHHQLVIADTGSNKPDTLSDEHYQMTHDAFPIFGDLSLHWRNLVDGKLESLRKGPQNDFWDFHLRTRLTATLGQLIHAIPSHELERLQARVEHHGRTYETQLDDSTRSTSAELAAAIFKHRRTIATGVPGLLSTLKKLREDESTISNFFRIKLVPRNVPGNAGLSHHLAPNIEVEVNIDEANRTTTLQSMRLVLDQRCIDYTLPRQTTDIQFKSETSMQGYLTSPPPEIVTFLDNSNLNVWGTEPFGTPSTLALNVPWQIFEPSRKVRQPADVESISGKNANGKADSLMEDQQDRDTATEEKLKKIENASDDLVAKILPTKINHNMTRKTDDQEGPASISDKFCERVSTEGKDEDDHDLHSLSSGKIHTKQSAKSVDLKGPAILDESLRSGKITALDEIIQTSKVDYVFECLEVHSRLQTFYEGFPLIITTIEAGQIGGKREEVHLEIPGLADKAIELGEDGGKKHLDIAKSYFTSFQSSLLELIGRLPK